MGSDDYYFTIEKIDPRGRFFVLNFKRETQYVFDENFIKVGGGQNTPPVRSDKGELYDVLKDTGGKTALVVNGTDNTKWRAVWISDGTGDDIYALVKSSIIWAFHRSWWNVMRSISGEYTKISYFVSQGEEFHEPYWVELNMWYIY